jgi:hypothetical protein
MARKIFISYRRDDSAAQAGRVHERLTSEFGRDLLFIDVDGIPLGANFVEVLRDEVTKCEVLLALIGSKWLNAQDENGNRRLDDPNDFVRVEISAALERDIKVIPIFLDEARPPRADQLPRDLEELAVRQGLDVRHKSFRSDIAALIQELKGTFNLRHRDYQPEAGSTRVIDVNPLKPKPFVRIRVEFDGSSIRDEVVQYNPEAGALYGVQEDEQGRVDTRELLGSEVLVAVRRLSAWMDNSDFDAFYKDQMRAAEEFAREKWATARVPIRFNAKHPNPNYRNKAFLPIMKFVKDERQDVIFAEVYYYDELL